MSGCELLEPARQHVQPRVDPVDVVARDSQSLFAIAMTNPRGADSVADGQVAQAYPPIRPQFRECAVI